MRNSSLILLSLYLVSCNNIDSRFENLKRIQCVFLHCFYNSPKTEYYFKQLTNNSKTDFSRYNYFYAKYLVDIASEIEDKNISISFKDSGSPALIEDNSDKNSYYVIMPMKI